MSGVTVQPCPPAKPYPGYVLAKKIVAKLHPGYNLAMKVIPKGLHPGYSLATTFLAKPYPLCSLEEGMADCYTGSVYTLSVL